MDKKKNKLEWRNGRYFENGKLLTKKDYILHFSAHDVNSVVSCRTGQKYRLTQINYI